MLKQRSEDQIQKSFMDRNISVRTAKVQLKSVYPGDSDKPKRSAVVSRWIRERKPAA